MSDQLIVIVNKIRERHKLDESVKVGVKSLAADVEFEDSDPYKFTARITSNVLDRDREVLLPSGMIATDFKKSGALFWNHDYDQPIGYPGKLTKGKDADGTDYIECVGNKFMKRPADYVGEFLPDFARAYVTQAVENGMMPGVSVGFIPFEGREPSKKDLERWPECRWVHTRWSLLEFSVAPVQSNPDATVTAMGKSLGCFRGKSQDVYILPETPTLTETPVVLNKPSKVITIVEPQPKRQPIVIIAPPQVKAVKRDDTDKIVAKTLAKMQGKIYV